MFDHASSAIPAGARADVAPEASSLEREVVALFDQLRDRLLRYVISMGLLVPDAEEIIQEAFLALFRHLQQGKPRYNLRAWLFQVAHNLALKQYLRGRRDRDNVAQYGGTSAGDFFVDHTPNPEAQISRRERESRLFGVWEALPELDQRCLSLRAEGLTYREISQVLEISLGSVAISLARSLERFARADGR
jgi:RNA polymerase sigma-70 factor (ECF subfamily)